MPEFNQEKFDAIISDIAENGLSLRKALKKNTLSSATFYEWIEDTDRQNQYARATELRAAAMFDDIIDIADCSENDVDIIEIGEGQFKQVVNHEVVNRSKLRVDARKWALSKMFPKKYGDSIKVESDVNVNPHITGIDYITPNAD